MVPWVKEIAAELDPGPHMLERKDLTPTSCLVTSIYTQSMLAHAHMLHTHTPKDKTL